MTDRDFASLEELNDAMRREFPSVAGVGGVVGGEGSILVPIAFVGEQPGDAEDREGRPFVGPAGRLLDHALAEAEIDRGEAYMTNAVKQFHFTERGKRRIHRKPRTGEIVHQRWWLWREIDLVRPRVIVALGATAGLALAGRSVAVMRERGPMAFGNRRGVLTVHPSYLLRLPDATAKQASFDAFVSDLRQARQIAQAAS
ncbi:UdgX family uracil-DNA binding protein [Pleomorphomonas sp. NRK KF1]|uniref:UdgX family uracil-DNA binding protein n=1 Tax=Pleomorphomonas sp. NRK KF1 TaxID=2943000 RepID=UPI0020442C93|nr:UdgX family uracil-DNA binding protein [Pleomorphomonas sp. NRK KF1]MCM5552836.1 UdgX family uracil-DNA binding protein [Pleomorphomonas sp. NRK KF1]